jgi:hypothetical protein
MNDYEHLVGHRFPGGHFTLSPHMAWLWADCVLSDPDPEEAHPSLSYQAAMKGCGITIQDVFELMDATADSGVMFGEVVLDYFGTLVPGDTYALEGGITDVTRKTGRRAGTFDLLSFEIIGRREGEPDPLFAVATTWVFPRHEDGVS